MQQHERRGGQRLPFSGTAYLTYDGRCRSEAVVDVSADGLQIRSGVRLKPGKEVKVFLPLPAEDGWRMCLLKGKVVRRDRAGRGDGRLGIALTPDEVDTRGLLAAFVGEA